MKRNFWIALALIVLVGIALFLQQGYRYSGAVSAAQENPVFVDISWPAGIRDNRKAGIEMTAGQAWGDYNNDGWLDLYVTDSKGPNTLYVNNGDGTFSLSPLNDQVSLPNAYSNGATFADFNNDGWRDLYVANWGEDALFLNDGGEHFVNVTTEAGIHNDHNTKSASWGDYDNDGDLDLYLANWSCYPECGRPMDGDVDQLYRNNGDGTFTNVTQYLRSSLNGAGFIATFNDYDNDGDLDIYLVNDEFVNPLGNKLWRNDGPGCEGWCFTEVSAEAGANSFVFGMGLAVGDYDNDGDLDYYYSNVGPMELLRNNGDGTFTDVAEQAGVQVPNGIGWGAVFFDYDNDGWLDLYLSIVDTTDHNGLAANPLFHNNRDGTFTRVDCANEASDVHMSIGVAYADYNQDGWVDLVVGNQDEGYRLYENRAWQSTDSHWLAIELTGAGPVNRDAVGTRVYVTTPDGLTQMREITNGSALGAGSELAAYFGTGKYTHADVTVRWPDGTEQTFQRVSADQRYALAYPLEEGTDLAPLQRAAAAAALRVPLFQVPDGHTLGLTVSGLLAVIGLGAPLLVMRNPKKSIPLAISGVCLLLAAGAYLQTEGLFRYWGETPQEKLSRLMDDAGVYPPTMPELDAAKVKLGEALFWDPILSGNRDTACVTCHHPQTGTGDNLSLPIGTGGVGLDTTRVQLDSERSFIPRNATPVYNLGYTEWTVFFWDGRVHGTDETGFYTPASDRMLPGLENLLAAQAMFPVTSRDEMRGLRGDLDIFGNPNELAALPDYTARPIWSALMVRLLAIPEYVDLFNAAYPDIPTDQLTFAQAANAISAYESYAFTFEDSPYDRYIRGDETALTDEQKRGAILFYGEAGCATCHSGPLLTDQQFYNMGVPQLGPGKGRDEPFDYGLARETGNACDLYAFRTPPLRNVSLTGPYMHNGAYATLEEVIRHQLDPETSLANYDPGQLIPSALETTCLDDTTTMESILSTLYSDSASAGVRLTDAEINDLLAFLESFTSPSAVDLTSIIPTRVPSGLAVGGNIQNP